MKGRLLRAVLSSLALPCGSGARAVAEEEQGGAGASGDASLVPLRCF
jgi:hypothetical protein